MVEAQEGPGETVPARVKVATLSVAADDGLVLPGVGAAADLPLVRASVTMVVV
jgi:imidazoleglycerol phosphate synthase glutamine amidotransferase subunit HisH